VSTWSRAKRHPGNPTGLTFVHVSHAVNVGTNDPVAMVDLVRNGELHDDSQSAATDERGVTSSEASQHICMKAG
jgi:hypothetical protein